MGVGVDGVAAALQAAGYARVEKVATDRDFVVSDTAILVKDHSVEVLITFDDGRISSVSPQAVHRFAPSELAGMANGGERRRPVARADLPEHVVLAVLAMEDARFFEHPGFDAFGIVRAVVANLMAGRRQQGGSTLTQQLAKNLFLSPTKSLERKFRELALAVALEERLTKDEILELYLNQIYLGQVGGVAICGIDQAAQTYFGTSARRLNLAQAATLAGVISAPNRYSPVRHPERAEERRALVLKRMADVGWIEPTQAADAAAKSVTIVARQNSRNAPWALDHAISVLEADLGEGVVADRGLSVRTTVDALLQRVAEQAVAKGLTDLTRTHPSAAGAEVALVALDPTNGGILAMVGGASYARSSFNRAVDGMRQVGSTVKPLSWLFAYDANPSLAPTSPVPDLPIEREVNGETWAPNNYDGEFLEKVNLDEALALSRNIPAVHVSEWVGLESLAERLASTGLSNARAYPSTALGAFDASPMDLAAAYSIFPGAGKVVRPRIVEGVRLPDGTDGFRQRVEKFRVASPRAVHLTTTSLQRTMEWGTGRRAAEFGVEGFVGGKTGTTDGGRDAWFAGFTDTIVVAVWVGFDKGRDLGLTGAQAALPIWADFVANSGRMVPVGPPPPETVVAIPVCQDSSLFATTECPNTKDEWFSEDAERAETCVLHGPKGSGAAAIIQRLRERFDKDEAEAAPAKPKKKWGWFRRRSD
jgi:penicillin-binding protein 1B